MYVLKPGIKEDPRRHWALPDRIFFGRGACHILAGVYLQRPPLTGFYAERIIPVGSARGSHVYLTDGFVAFDCLGYSARRRLLDHHGKGCSRHYPGWDCVIETVDFDLLDTAELNRRNMSGPDQFLSDAAARARAYLARIDHSLARIDHSAAVAKLALLAP
jgi:hypothetical protein